MKVEFGVHSPLDIIWFYTLAIVIRLGLHALLAQAKQPPTYEILARSKIKVPPGDAGSGNVN